MLRKVNIIDNQLEEGQVKVIYSNGGRNIDYIEMLTSSNSKQKMYVNRSKKCIECTIEDVDINMVQMEFSMDLNTVTNYLNGLRDALIELKKLEEE